MLLAMTGWELDNASLDYHRDVFLSSTGATLQTGVYFGNAVQILNSNSVQYKNSILASDGFVVGFHFYIPSDWESDDTPASFKGRIFEIADTADSTKYRLFNITTGGLLKVWRQNPSSTGPGDLLTLVGSSQLYDSASFLDNWHHIEIKFKETGLAGDLIIKGGGNTFTPTNPIDGFGSVNVKLGYNSLKNPFYDNFFICDQTGSTHNDFLGEVIIEGIRPSGVGSSTAWTSSNANPNWQNLQDQSDSTYVSTSTNLAKDLYAFGDLANTGDTISAVKISSKMRNTGFGTSKVRLQAKTGANSSESDKITVSDSLTQKVHSVFMNTKPGGGSWTKTDINSSEFGMKTDF